jgi:cell division transport system ATP-binding protein
MTDPRTDDRNVIGIYHVTRQYGDHLALDDVSLTVANGEFVFLVGPSGAGKSTLMRMIYMDELPSEGQVVVGEYVSTRIKRKHIPHLRRRVGVVFQDFKLLDDRSVFENVAIAMRVTGAGSFDIKRRVNQVINQVGLFHKRRDLPDQLSGGEQQRVAIARALVNSPAILLADEPTGNLDPEVTEDILRLLFKINSGGTAVLMATHDHQMVRNFGQRIVHLRDGKLYEDKRSELVGNLSDRLDQIQLERQRTRRVDDAIREHKRASAQSRAAMPVVEPIVDEVVSAVVEPASEAIRAPLNEPAHERPAPIATPAYEEDDNVS